MERSEMEFLLFFPQIRMSEANENQEKEAWARQIY